MAEKALTGTVFNIQRYSIHDGPGIRTTIFLKGCPLSCIWCANPEGQHFGIDLQFVARKCTGCQRCAAICSEGSAIAVPGGIQWNKAKCTECFRCVDACRAHAREACGCTYTVDELLEIVSRDGTYYRKSGGGVTLSGGEPLCQPEFAAALLHALRERGINTAIETCGYYPWHCMERAIGNLNTIFMDIKLMDAQEHERVTGKRNEQILENVTKTAQRIDPSWQKLIIRTPVIPGINDSEEHIQSIAQFVKSLGTVSRYELLPYHNYGEAKWDRTKWTPTYPLKGLEALSVDSIRPLKDIVAATGLETN